jgi:hypothetical protein
MGWFLSDVFWGVRIFVCDVLNQNIKVQKYVFVSCPDQNLFETPTFRVFGRGFNVGPLTFQINHMRDSCDMR